MAIATNKFAWRRYWLVGLTLLLGMAVSVALGWRLHRQAVELDRQRLQRIAESVRDRLQTKLQTTDLIQRHAQDYFGSQEIITEGMFREWCKKYGWSVTAPWIHGMALYTNSSAGNWHEHLPTDPAVWTESDFETFWRLANYNPIHLKKAFGYSHDSAKRWPAHYATALTFDNHSFSGLLGAVLANTPQITDRQIVIERDGAEPFYGATVAVPVYEVNRDELRDRIVGSPPKVNSYIYNWNLCRGVLLAPIDFVKLESLIWGDATREVGVEIYASPAPREDSWLNEAGPHRRALDSVFKPYLAAKIPWVFYNAKWSLFVYTLPVFEAGSPRYMAYVTFAAGAGLTLLASALLGVALRARHRQELMTEQISEARDALAVAQQERQKLSHDLHDNTIQTLYAIQLGLNHTAQKIDADPAKSRNELSAVRGELDSVIAEIRRFITSEETAGKDVDLQRVLSALAERARARTSARIEVHCDSAAAARLSAAHAVQLANIAREALSNSLRHANPQKVELALRAGEQEIRFEVSDDGIGFDPQSPTPGVGLTSMAARAREIGGTLDIQSSPGHGTRIMVRIPVSPAEFDSANHANKERGKS